ncbi:hypothetical protein TPHA_0G00115 [Tetrapisispora phaffii CBS 4417]|uniref:Uncharacterized protein n=1 Tax=Tetrapisispora phaffii (strain ATCC 24235 / CBS 4417 / NBRC 1672 / NRRL Y-8282 / UCD 70-5) TaxID=1071381 RepID=G8BVC5_TETPH|nr:hypothetical protein TPHA_0G00115 [Tetrapisispora phaffii CBS 4417]CCE63853.1 hypothetical protein TPHA_0G00115 [Tetrapisispora phaffii CBS 4417]
MQLLSFLLFLNYFEQIFAGTSDVDAGSYDQVEEPFGNVDLSVTDNKGLYRAALYGAFSYSATNAAIDWLAVCRQCKDENKIPKVDCLTALRSTARTISIGVFGVAAWANGALKRDAEYQGAMTWGNIVKIVITPLLILVWLITLKKHTRTPNMSSSTTKN